MAAQTIAKEFIQETPDGLRVYRVDGAEVRQIDVDFALGAHGLVRDYIPPNEVWVERMADPKDQQANLAHELYEYRLMRDKKLPYEEAHRQASLAEAGERILQQMGEGLRYNGPWMDGEKFVGHTFTDVAVTGTTFVCVNPDDCKERLTKKRQEFGMQPAVKLVPATSEDYHKALEQIKREYPYPLYGRDTWVRKLKQRGIEPPEPEEPEEEEEEEEEEEMEPAIIGKYPDMERAKKYVERVPLPPGTPLPVLKGTEPTAKPPRELTMDQYRKFWRPKGWNIIFIGPTETWRQEWGIWEAIREIVQNALDEAEAYEWGYDKLGLYIKDKGRGIGVQDFLLGPPKLKPEYARGKYGEGMKIGALALVREGYPVFVETVGRELWVVFLEQEANGKVKSLAALWRPGGTKEGTTWHIVNYKGEAFSDRFAVNLPKHLIIARVPSLVKEPVQRYNQLIEHPPTGSVIFARDIYMRSINSPYSYNLWSFDLAPDRHAPKDESAMWTDVGRVWSNVSQVEHLEIFLKMVCDPPRLQTSESNNVQFSWMGEDPVSGQSYLSHLVKNKAAWNQAWAKVFGDSAVIRTDDRWDGTVKHLGYNSVSLQYMVRDTLDNVIKSDKQLIAESQERLREVSIIPDEQLTPRALASLTLARMIAEQLRFQTTRVGGVHAAIIPPASDRVRTAGLYGRSTQEIFISADMLEHGRQTVDTVIHELAHHSSGAEDLEEKHAAAMTALAGRVVEKTAGGAFDKYLAEPFRW